MRATTLARSNRKIGFMLMSGGKDAHNPFCRFRKRTEGTHAGLGKALIRGKAGIVAHGYKRAGTGSRPLLHGATGLVISTGSHRWACVIVWYIPHARTQMEARRVTHADVEAVLANPEVVRTKKNGRQGAWAMVRGRSIMVIHVPDEDGQSTIVVTVYPQRRKPK
jgi:hypothetical protein